MISATCMWATQSVPRRSPPPWANRAKAPCRGLRPLVCATPPSVTRSWWPSRRPCGGCPRWRASISISTRSATRASPPSWRRRCRHQVRCRRRLEGWRSSSGWTLAGPHIHQDHRRRLRHPRRCARRRRAANARGPPSTWQPCQRGGPGGGGSRLDGALPRAEPDTDSGSEKSDEE